MYGAVPRITLTSFVVGQRLGESEVQNFHFFVVRELDVRRLQVSMNDPMLVRVFKSLGDLASTLEGFIDRKWTSRQSIRKRFAWDQLHHQESNAVRLLEPVDGRDTRVIQ
jgi:hypothetical protein